MTDFTRFLVDVIFCVTRYLQYPLPGVVGCMNGGRGIISMANESWKNKDENVKDGEIHY